MCLCVGGKTQYWPVRRGVVGVNAHVSVGVCVWGVWTVELPVCWGVLVVSVN